MKFPTCENVKNIKTSIFMYNSMWYNDSFCDILNGIVYLVD